MKAIGLLMVLIGVALGIGSIMELVYSRPDSSQFWVAVFTTPAAAFFAVAGVVLWVRGLTVRWLVFVAALLVCTATVAGTALGVMGAAPALIGVIGPLVVVGWFLRTRKVAA
jgi:hypothetical protein